MKKKAAKPTRKQATDTGVALDAFQNIMARLGFGTPHIMEGTDYPLTRLTRNYNLMNSLYRTSWIVRKVIDTIPEDCCKNWIELKTQEDPEKLDRFHKLEKRAKVRAAIKQGMKWGRLYGGAAGVMMIAGHENYLDKPLDLDTVLPDSFKGILILDRWSGISPTAEMVEDINDPDFGLPLSYRVTTVDGKGFNVHASRVLRFIGRDLPQWEKQAEMQWGISEIEVIYEELKKRDNTSWNIASLIFMANLRVFKMKDMAQLLASNSKAAQDRLYNTVAAMNHLMSNQGVQIIGNEDDFDTKQYSFTGINDVYQSFMLDLCGACGIPMTRLFGRSPGGLNATGESDEDNYESLISEKQDSELRPQLEKLVPVMCLSEWGEVPEDIDFAFNPYKTLDGKERAELAKSKTDSLSTARNNGGISQKIYMKELRALSEETGMFTNIEDEDIEKADDTLDDRADLMGGLPGNKDFAPKKQDNQESAE